MPLFSTASLVAGGLVSMSLPAKAATYFQGGSLGFLVPVLAKIISWASGSFLPCQNSRFSRQIRFASDDAHLALRGRRQLGDVLFGVDVDAADENAVDAFEVFQLAEALPPAPHRVAGGPILPFGENQGDVQRHAGGGQAFQGAPGRPGVAGTLIMRFLWPADHFLPSST